MVACDCVVSASLLVCCSRSSQISTVIEAMECLSSLVIDWATSFAMPSCKFVVMRNPTAANRLAVSTVSFGCREWVRRNLTRVSSMMSLFWTVQPSFTRNFLASSVSFITPRAVLAMFFASSSEVLGVIGTPLECVPFGGGDIF